MGGSEDPGNLLSNIKRKQLNSLPRIDDSEATPKGVIGHYAGSRSCKMRSNLKGLVSPRFRLYLIAR